MKHILTAVFIITASGANATGRYVTTALPNGDIVITDSNKGNIRKCKWERVSWGDDNQYGYVCSVWQTIVYSDG